MCFDVLPDGFMKVANIIEVCQMVMLGIILKLLPDLNILFCLEDEKIENKCCQHKRGIAYKTNLLKYYPAIWH
ncbi:Uncharacterised protein [Mycobacterium tuberculosis]|nr:Uncharacterised protein [Mycobacterium tuberculosis]